MCFQWLKRIYHCLRGRCARRRNRCFSELQGQGSFYCGGEGSVTYSRGASPCPPMMTSSTYGVAGGYSCGSDGSVVITSGDNRDTSGWGVAVGTVPVYGTGGGTEYSGEDSGRIVVGGSSGRGRAPSITGYGYGYDASPRDKVITGGDGPGYYSGGLSYGTAGCSGPEFSSGGGASSKTMQQKCPVVVPDIKTQQSKQSSHWPPSQKK